MKHVANTLRQESTALNAKRNISADFNTDIAKLVIGKLCAEKFIKCNKNSRTVRTSACKTCLMRNTLNYININSSIFNFICFKKCVSRLVCNILFIKRDIVNIAGNGYLLRFCFADCDSIIKIDTLHNHK